VILKESSLGVCFLTQRTFCSVKEYSFYIAGKAHRILNALFHIPGFFKLFRFFMRKGMTGEEIWISQKLADNANEYSTDVLKCLWFDTCTYFNCPEICEIFCLCDHIVFGNIKKLHFNLKYCIIKIYKLILGR